jgi:hypothetical protein
MWFGTDDDSDIVIILHHWALFFASFVCKEAKAQLRILPKVTMISAA